MRIDEKIEKHLEDKKEVSLTIKMPMKKFKELKSEINIKTTMGQMNPSMSMVEKLAIYYVMSIEKGETSIRFKK